MNLEALKQHVRKVTKAEWQGETVYLRKIGAADGMAMLERITALKNETLDEGRDREETMAYYATAISKSLADESGELTLDSDEGREALKQVPFTELCELGEIVLRHSGFWADEAKKNLPTKNGSPIDSASLSNGRTPTPCTLT